MLEKWSFRRKIIVTFKLDWSFIKDKVEKENQKSIYRNRFLVVRLQIVQFVAAEMFQFKFHAL